MNTISNITVLHFAILALAVWRWSSLLVDEDGLLNMFEKLRTWTGVRYMQGETGELEQVVPDDTPRIRKVIAGWLTCRWCCSLWLGGIVTIVYLLWPNVISIALPWALSAGAIIVDAIVGRRYRRRVYFR